ncbi:MAG: hypothetical protein OES84_03005 [Kiritimatiellaceae bacterium]|nr:hypothetical protein [Kiritimatiellaceae bacterium]
MSETDIYKNREALPSGAPKPPRKNRKRRSNSQRAFDDRPRERRSRNSGMRRFLHLSRKKDNEKVFWWTILISILVVLSLIAFWQFVIFENMVRSEEQKDDYMKYQRDIPSSTQRDNSVAE